MSDIKEIFKESVRKIIASINPGTKDISQIGDGTLKGAIYTLSENLEAQVRYLGYSEVNNSTPTYVEKSRALKIFCVNGWDSALKPLTPTPSASCFWIVLQIPYAYSNAALLDKTDNVPSAIVQLWISCTDGKRYSRAWQNETWSAFV